MIKNINRSVYVIQYQIYFLKKEWNQKVKKRI